MESSSWYQYGCFILVPWLSQCWKVLCILLGKKSNQQSYSAMKLVSYNNDWPDKICPLVHSGMNVIGVIKHIFIAFKSPPHKTERMPGPII